jgi:hypothetical protein
MSCLVCLDDYKGKIKPITCQYCPANACVKCTERYLLQSFEDPHCMTCKRGWGPEFMAASFTKSFRSAFRLHRRRVLFEREKAILPALQIYVEYKKDSEKLKKEIDALEKVVGTEWGAGEDNKKSLACRWRVLYEEHSKLGRLINESTRLINEAIHQIEEVKGQMKPKVPLEVDEVLEPDIPPLDRMATLTELRKKRDDCKKQREEHREKREATGKALQETGPHYIQQKERLRGLVREYNRLIRLYNDQGVGDEVKEKREFIMRCPADDCRGFLSTAYKCGTCSKWACQKCLVVIGEDQDAEHTCNPDTVETAKAIRSETRPCPKCGTRIFKIDGCDQMFCVMEGCGTAFSWNTGHIVTGVIHNPHYYEWLRRNGGGAAPREAGDIPCGGMPTAWQFVRALHVLEIPNDIKTILMESFRGMQDLIQVRLPKYPARMPQLINKENDIAYLMNLLEEDEWKRQLEFTEARFNRKKEIGQILQTMVTAGSDMMNRLFDSISNNPAEMTLDAFVGWLLDTAIPELEQLRLFGNESLRVLARRDQTAVPQLEENWQWKGARALYKTTIVENKSVE